MMFNILSLVRRKEVAMGIVYAEITLKNATDVTNTRRGLMKEQDVRQTTTQAMVDTGSITMVINEDMRQKLGLEVLGLKRTTLANEAKEIVKIVEAVEVHWKDRFMTCQPMVVNSAREILLGAIPLEDMDLMVDPKRQELVGVHGDEAIYRL
jgi:clan AA aspartic protease